MRPSNVPLTIGRVMFVAALALSFCAFIWLALRSTSDAPSVQNRSFIGLLCEIEADFMESRRAACVERAEANAPWEAVDEETQDLKIHPFPSDDAPCSSWSEQAAVWERAAAKCARAAALYGGL